jgi:hypothetical protein
VLYAGERLAIHEFNEANESIKIDRWFGIDVWRPFMEQQPRLNRCTSLMTWKRLAEPGSVTSQARAETAKRMSGSISNGTRRGFWLARVTFL